MRRILGAWSSRFWAWYERHYGFNLALAACLFTLQLVHLYWLTADVVMTRFSGTSLFQLGPGWRLVIVLVDYTEIPTLIGVSLVYLYELRSAFSWRSLAYLFFLNSQWVHIFWITDEFVVEAFRVGALVAFPAWLAWLAIGVDYLELPVIVETFARFLALLRREGVRGVFRQRVS